MEKISTEFDRHGSPVIELKTELPRRIFCILDPDLIALFFMNKSVSIHKPKGILPREEWLMRGALNADHGGEWKRKRKAMGRLFTPRAINTFFDPIGPAVNTAFSRLDVIAEHGEPVNICQEASRFVTDLSLRMFFSAELPGAELDRVAELVSELESGMPEQVPLWMPTPGNQTFKKRGTDLRALLMNLVRQRQALPPQNEDILDHFLSYHDDELDRKWTNEEILDQMLAVFLGATAIGVPLYWTAFLLATNPSHYDRVVAELEEHCGNKPIPSAEDAKSLVYLDSVLKESMRLFPPFWGNIRYTYDDVEIGGHSFPANSTFFLLRYFANRNPKYWLSPQSNDPRRFNLTGDDAVKTSHFIPFGAGPRTCPGIHLAPLIAKVFLAGLARRYKISFPSTRPNGFPEFSFLYGLYPKEDIHLKLEKR